MKKFPLVAAAFVAAITISGAEAKEYKAAERPGASGYFNVLEEGGFWAVGYTGDPGQSEREIAQYAMKRAGDLAAEQHQEWFAVLSTTNRMVQAGVPDDLQTRAGNFMGSGAGANTSAPTAGAPATDSRNNTGTFGGGSVPNNVLERWEKRRVRQTILLIELGSGDDASFPGLERKPEIFPATPAGATAPAK